jgi:hypothetical protein
MDPVTKVIQINESLVKQAEDLGAITTIALVLVSVMIVLILSHSAWVYVQMRTARRDYESLNLWTRDKLVEYLRGYTQALADSTNALEIISNAQKDHAKVLREVSSLLKVRDERMREMKAVTKNIDHILQGVYDLTEMIRPHSYVKEEKEKLEKEEERKVEEERSSSSFP